MGEVTLTETWHQPIPLMHIEMRNGCLADMRTQHKKTDCGPHQAILFYVQASILGFGNLQYMTTSFTMA